MANQNVPGDILAFSQKWVSVVGGGSAVFFFMPPFYEYSAPWISDFTLRHYGVSFVWPTQIVWWSVGAASIFFTTCAITIATLRIVFARFFRRFF